jgi:uncharacterized protein
LLFEGGRILVDASFRREADRRTFLDLADRLGVPAMFLLCRADPSIVRSRLAARRGDPSDADWAIYQEAAARWEEPGPGTRLATRQIDTSEDRGRSLSQAAGALRELGLQG